MEPADDSASHVECTIPVLPVRDLSRSLDFYTEMLGFSVDWVGEQKLACSVSRDGCSIMLLQTVPWNGPSCVWVGLRNDSLFAEFRAKGAKVRQEPRNERWAYEMKFEDIDGNVLWLGTEPKPDVPFAE